MQTCNHEEFRTDWRGETAIAVCSMPTPCPYHSLESQMNIVSDRYKPLTPEQAIELLVAQMRVGY